MFLPAPSSSYTLFGVQNLKEALFSCRVQSGIQRVNPQGRHDLQFDATEMADQFHLASFILLRAATTPQAHEAY